MEEQQIGWIPAIIIGGIAGWLAEQFMKSQMGLVMNIVLGMIGAAVASWLMGFLGISLGGGWIGYLIAGFIGAASSSRWPAPSAARLNEPEARRLAGLHEPIEIAIGQSRSQWSNGPCSVGWAPTRPPNPRKGA